MKQKNFVTAAPDADLVIVRQKGLNAKGYGHIAKRVLTDRTVDIGTKGFYCYISAASGSSDKSFMRRSRMLAELNIGLDAYNRYMSTLEDRGYIIRAQSRTEGGVFGTTIIEFVLIPSHLADEIAAQKEAETQPFMYSGTIYGLGYGSMPRLVSQDPKISIKAKGLFGYISVFASTRGEAFPSRDKILKDLGVNKDSYGKYLRELTDAKYITTSRVREGGKLGTTMFQINMFPDDADIPCPKNPTTVDDAPCPKNPITVDDAPCPKNPTTVDDAPCPKKPTTVEPPCPKKTTTDKTMSGKPNHGIYINNTILGTNTNSFVLDRLIERVREQIHYSIMRYMFVNDPMAQEALDQLVGAIVNCLNNQNARIQLGREVFFTKHIQDVLMRATNNDAVAVLDRYLARANTVDDPYAYLLRSIYSEILERESKQYLVAES